MILNMLANDSFTVSDFKAVGLSAENTKLESEEKYKQSEMIQENELFKDNEGNFDENKFHQYYLYATSFYNNLADETYIEDLSKNTFYSKDNLFAPEGSKTIDEVPRFVISPNPFLQTESLVRVGQKGDRTLSISEIAQKQKIYDSKEQKFKEESVNDRALGQNVFKWLGDLFSEPLVIAQWDEDGQHVDALTGEIKNHKKGDYKYNEDGTFYYETLNGRDVYGKQVLNRMNTLTVDGSKINKYDFFDSDDLEQKHVVGTTLKNLALVGSMFIPWNIGYAVRAASIATQSAGLLGTLGKMFLGSENETANNLHGWAKTVNRQSASEYASQNTWCWENMINMIGDTVGQLAEQRFLFTHVPALIKGTKGIKAGKSTKTFNDLVDQNALKIQEQTKTIRDKSLKAIKANNRDDWYQQAQELTEQWKTSAKLKSAAALEKYMNDYRDLGGLISKAYMTGITVQDTYGEAKANGASDLEAFALTLGYAAGEAWILNTGLGEWIMPELQGDKLKYRSIVNALKNQVKPLSKEATDTASKEGRQNLLKQIFNIGKKVATDDYAKAQFASSTYEPMKVVLAHAMGEGFEEVSEEVLADFSKSAFNVVNWLRGDETRIAGAWENMGDRYGMSLLGGFIGGGISSVGTDFSNVRQMAKMSNESAIQEIIYMVNNDKIDDFLKYVNKADLAPKYLSFDTDEQGNYKPGTKENNQDLDIKKALNEQIKIIRNTLNAEGAKFSENSLFDALTLKDLRYLQLRDTKTAGLYFQEYNSILSDIYKESEHLRELLGENTNTDSGKKQLTESEQGEVAKARQKLNDLRVKKDAFISGKRAPEFIATALYEAQQALHAHNRGYTWQEWAEAQTHKKFEELSETDLKDLLPKYKAYRDTEMKNDILGDARQFVNMVGLASGAIQQQQDYIKSMLTTGKESALRVQTMLGNMFDFLNSKYDEDVDVDAFIQEVQEQLVGSLIKTSTDSAIPLFDDETKARLEYIDKAPETPDYTKEIKNQDKLYTIFEAFANYSDTITQKFIEQGYIHPEIKNHLINTYQNIINTLNKGKNKEIELSNQGFGDYDDHALELLGRLSAYFGADADTMQNIYDDMNRVDILRGYIDNMQEKIQQLKELHHTPVIQLLESFKTATSDSNLSVKDVLIQANNLLSQSMQDISSFSYGEDLSKQLEEVDELIDLVASALYATRTDKASVNNSWGYSKTLNELNRKYGNDQWIELAEIDGETADLIEQDLAVIKQKLLFAKNLNRVNNGQKLNKQNRVGYNKQFIFFNKFKRLVNILPKELKGWNLTRLQEVLQQDLLLEKYNHKDHLQRRFSLTEDEKIRIEEESLMLDDAIYNFFNDNSAKLQNIDELANFIDKCGFQLFDPATDLLSDENDDLDDNQFLFSLAARAALKGSSFYDALRKTFNDQKAPVPMQEQATYLNVAMVMNGDVVNNFAKAYATSVFRQFKNMSEEDKRSSLMRLGYTDASLINTYITKPELLQNDHSVEKFANIVLTEGIAGSGKTKGVFDSTVRIIKQIKPDLLDKVYLVNATLKNAEMLMNDLDLKGKAFSSSHSETEHDLLREFYTDYTSDYSGKVKLIDNKVVTTFKLREDLKDLPKIIFIDETSRYDYVQMKLLSEAAQHYGITVLVAGDFDQISATSHVKDGDNEFNFTPNRLNFIRSSKQGVSFRSLNSQMSKNQKEILANLHVDNKDTFNIFYWEDDKEIRGFKTHQSSDFDAIVSSVEKIKKLLKPGEKLGYLYAQEDKSIHKKLQDKFGDLIEPKSISDAQGLESDYYILDFNADLGKANITQQQRNELYTGITRAKIGGIIINDLKSSQKLIINNIREESSEEESITPQAIAKSSQKRAQIFEKIFKDKKPEPIEYHELTKVKKENIIVPSDNPLNQDENLPPKLSNNSMATIPEGMYISKEEADKVDLSVFAPGLELYDKDDNLIGTIQGTTVIESKQGDNTYYAPAVVVKTPDNSLIQLYNEKLKEYFLKNPESKDVVAKYKIDDVFYDSDGKMIKITSVSIQDENIQYQIEKEDGTTELINESDLVAYSTIKPEIESVQVSDNRGENEDPEIYKQRIEGANGSDIPQDVSVNSISHRMHTFNSYETGVLWVKDEKTKTYKIDPRHFEKGNPMQVRLASRIDNVNGLFNLGIVGQDVSKETCLEILDDIHSELMYNENTGDLLKKVSKILNPSGTLDLSSIQYGIKSSSHVSKDSGRVYGTDDNTKYPEYFIFDKHKDETIEYALPSVVEGDAISKKSVVAVFRDSSGKKVLEITVGVLNSPLTIGSRVDSNGEYIYKGVGELLAQLKPGDSGEKVFEVCNAAIQVCKVNNYKDLEKLFKAFLLTKNAFVPLHKKEEDFNLARKRNYGPRVIQRKGDYQKDGTRQYDVHYDDISSFIKNNKRAVVSKIWIPKTNVYDGHQYPIHPGYPGVFVSFNKKHKKEDLPSLYMDQMHPDYKGKIDVGFYYIIPPEASVKEYLRNYRNLYLNKIDGGTRPVLSIGNLWTSYQMLKNLHKITPLTEENFKSHYLDHVDLKDVVEYIEKLASLEERTNWEGDTEYEKLFEEYKRVYSGNPNLAKKYAIRNTVLQKQDRILRSPFKNSQKSVYSVFTQYLSQAIYWSQKPDEQPNEQRLQALEAANPHGIKYHVQYEGKGQLVGVFSPASTSNKNEYALDVMLEDGSIGVREFQINDKIDTPMFEFEELSTGIELLAEWDYENNDPTKEKVFRSKLNNGTQGYLRNGKTTPIVENNFEKLKKNNKILFKEGGLFEGIEVIGATDPAYSQVDFAKQILTKFNAIPNNLGFAIVDASGEVKMYAFKINELKGPESQSELESPKGLAGITIGMPLLLHRGGTDRFKFSSPNREYQVYLEGNEIVFTYTSNKKPITSKVELTTTNLLTQEVYDKALEVINKDFLFSSYFSGKTLEDVLTENFKQSFALLKYSCGDDLLNDSNFKILYDALTQESQSSININIGDVVSPDEVGSVRKIVRDINGSKVILEDGTELDVTTDTLYKIEDDKNIECEKPIKIKYD